MTIWIPNYSNIFEEQIMLKIEARQVDLKKLRLQLLSIETLLNASETHEYALRSSWAFLSRHARIISLNEARAIKKSLVSIWGDINVLKIKLNAIAVEIMRIELDVANLQIEREKVKLKIIEMKL